MMVQSPKKRGLALAAAFNALMILFAAGTTGANTNTPTARPSPPANVSTGGIPTQVSLQGVTVSASNCIIVTNNNAKDLMVPNASALEFQKFMSAAGYDPQTGTTTGKNSIPNVSVGPCDCSTQTITWTGAAGTCSSTINGQILGATEKVTDAHGNSATFVCSNQSGHEIWTEQSGSCSYPSCPSESAQWSGKGVTCSASLSAATYPSSVQLSDAGGKGSETASCQKSGEWAFSSQKCEAKCVPANPPQNCYGSFAQNLQNGAPCGGRYPDQTNPFTGGYSCPAGTIPGGYGGAGSGAVNMGSTGHEGCTMWLLFCWPIN
jgi:hypothetical protein